MTDHDRTGPRGEKIDMEKNARLIPIRVLIVDDSSEDSELMVRALTDGGYDPSFERVETVDAMKSALDTHVWDLVIADFSMPDFSGYGALASLRESGQDIPCIVVSGTIGEETAVKTMKSGANDYVMKDKLHRLAPAVERELREAIVRRESRKLGEDLLHAAQQWRSTFDTIDNPILLLDLDGTILRCNRALRDLVEKPYLEIIGRPCKEILHALCDCDDNCPRENVIATGLPSSASLQFQGRNFDAVLTPVTNDQGNCVGLVHVLHDVTERLSAETLLREKEEKYRLLSESSADVILTQDLEGNITYMNDTGLRLSGYTAAEIARLTVLDLFLPRTEPDGGLLSQREYESELCTRLGKSVPVEVREAPIMNGTQTSGMLLNARDISVRLQNEADLTRQRSLVEALMGNITDLIYFKDTQSRFMRINLAHAHVLGVDDPTQAIGKTDFDYFPPAYARAAQEAEMRIMETGKPLVNTEELLEREGRPDMWFATTKMPLYDEKNELIGTVGITRDNTEKVQLSKDLADLAKFPNENPNPVLRVATDGTIMYSNPSALSLVANPFFSVNGRLSEEWRSLVSDVNDHGKKTEVERLFGTATYHFVLVPGQGYDYINIYAYDITEQKNLEMRLLQSSKMEALGRFAGSIAHEFNNMMTVINAFSDVLISKLKNNEKTQSYAYRIKETGKKAAAITDQLLIFGRKKPTEPQLIDMKQALASVEMMLRPIVHKSIGLSFTCGPDIGMVRIDPLHIDQIIVNLVINARDAIEDGGSITVEAENLEVDANDTFRQFQILPGPYVVIRVSDTGTGMSADVREKIFEPFFSTKREGQGTGLGLAVVYQIVRDSKGDIRIASEPDKGTTFEILLPRTEPNREEPVDSQESTPPRRTHS